MWRPSPSPPKEVAGSVRSDERDRVRGGDPLRHRRGRRCHLSLRERNDGNHLSLRARNEKGGGWGSLTSRPKGGTRDRVAVCGGDGGGLRSLIPPRSSRRSSAGRRG